MRVREELSQSKQEHTDSVKKAVSLLQEFNTVSPRTAAARLLFFATEPVMPRLMVEFRSILAFVIQTVANPSVTTHQTQRLGRFIAYFAVDFARCRSHNFMYDNFDPRYTAVRNIMMHDLMRFLLFTSSSNKDIIYQNSVFVSCLLLEMLGEDAYAPEARAMDFLDDPIDNLKRSESLVNISIFKDVFEATCAGISVKENFTIIKLNTFRKTFRDTVENYCNANVENKCLRM
jgi:hypothetical protein